MESNRGASGNREEYREKSRSPDAAASHVASLMDSSAGQGTHRGYLTSRYGWNFGSAASF
jgi:hypothetical protein